MNFKYPEVNIPEGSGVCLDLGCGAGPHRQAIESAGYKWIGLDIDTSRGDARLIESDACRLPFKAETFDLVWMNCVLEHMPNPWVALKEMHRVLKNNGLICGLSGYIDPDSTHYCALSHLGLKKALIDTGFSACKITPSTSGFPVMLRKYFMYLGISVRWSTAAAFAISRLFFGAFTALIFVLGILRNIPGSRSIPDYKERLGRALREIDRDFAGYFKFCANKKDVGKKG